MKVPWKEILVILVLAVLVTAFSFFIERDVGCPKCTSFDPCFCSGVYDHGWPFSYYSTNLPIERASPVLDYESIQPVFILFDLLIFFLGFLIIWAGIKFAVLKSRYK